MFNQLKQWIRLFFGISNTEANGMLVLIVIMIAVIISPVLYRNLGYPEYTAFQEDSILLDSLIAEWDRPGENAKSRETSGIIPEIRKRLFRFNPNEISFSDMIELGMDTIIAARIVKYRNKGGKFRTGRDLLKIYDFPVSLFERIESYMDLPDEAKADEKSVEHDPEMEIKTGQVESGDLITGVQRFDINSSDTVRLKEVYGIGSVLSLRILKYRDLLGGFTDPGQLGEIYGLKGDALQRLEESVFVDPAFVPRRIHVNFAGWSEFVRHPYISRDLANSLVNIRARHGAYQSPSDFQEATGMEDSLFLKLIPYIEF